MQKNKYVNFVSDEHFLSCIKWVCESYVRDTIITVKEMQKNIMDPFKMIFDITNNGITVHDWIRSEATRQADKTINNRIGDFHQRLLGGVQGWKNLGVGDESEVDLKKIDNSIFIELKNKFNTVNSSSLAQSRQKLERILRKYPKAKAYWAFVIDKSGDSGDAVWVYNGKNDPRIRKVWGKQVYELITGDADALIKVWKALPLAISDVLKRECKISSEDMKELVILFETAFHTTKPKQVKLFE